MSAPVAFVDLDLAPEPELSAPEWRSDLAGRLERGARVVTMFGRRVGGDVVLSSVTVGSDGRFAATRARVPAGRPIEALTPTFTSLGCFERELHEQTGLPFEGHPWLKPIRFAGAAPASRDDYPFYSVHGKEVHEVAVGPIHAGVIEPGAFRFMCLGEVVHHLEIHLGYQHRGVEALLLQRPLTALPPLIETIAGDTSIAHGWAHAAAIERLAGRDADVDLEIQRAILLELERVAMHLASLSGLAADIGFLQGATSYGRLRTTAINATMRLSGSRFGRGAVRPGGMRARLPPEGVAPLRDALALLTRDLPAIDDCFLEAQTVRHRLRDVGRVTDALARELGLVGLAARASGVAIDGRWSAGGAAYRELPVPAHARPEGDCWARARVRIDEIHASLAWLSRALDRSPAWDRQAHGVGALTPNRLVVALVEGFRGEVIHAVETDGDGRLAHYKVQDPSLRNWMGLALAVRGEQISNFPICNKSFDLSYCGSDL